MVKECLVEGKSEKTCLIVICHSDLNRINSMLVKHIRDIILKKNYRVITHDLVKEGFNATMSEREKESYFTTSYDSSDLVDYVDSLAVADALVVVFPVWWFGMPANLKGWFDRVWAPQVVFDHSDDLKGIYPKLLGLKNAIVVATYGCKWWVDYFVMFKSLSRILKKGIFGFSVPKCNLKIVSIYDSRSISLRQLSKKISEIDGVLNKW